MYCCCCCCCCYCCSVWRVWQAIVHVLVSPLKPGGIPTPGAARGEEPGQSSRVTASDVLPPVAGLAAAITARMGIKDRCFVNRNVVATVLTLLNSLRPEHVKGPDKSACSLCWLAVPAPTCNIATRDCRVFGHCRLLVWWCPPGSCSQHCCRGS
jgi:hypothetical protein